MPGRAARPQHRPTTPAAARKKYKQLPSTSLICRTGHNGPLCAKSSCSNHQSLTTDAASHVPCMYSSRWEQPGPLPCTHAPSARADSAAASPIALLLATRAAPSECTMAYWGRLVCVLVCVVWTRHQACRPFKKASHPKSNEERKGTGPCADGYIRGLGCGQEPLGRHAMAQENAAAGRAVPVQGANSNKMPHVCATFTGRPAPPLPGATAWRGAARLGGQGRAVECMCCYCPSMCLA